MGKLGERMNAGIKEEARGKERKKQVIHRATSLDSRLICQLGANIPPTVTSRNSPMLKPPVQRTSVNLHRKGKWRRIAKTQGKHCRGEDPQGDRVVRGQREKKSQRRRKDKWTGV